MLKALLQEEIKKQRAIRLDRFIELALYHETFGYYRCTVPVGKPADFITAPEISSIFGELIGLFLLDYWQRSDCPSPLRLIELGPGKGTMMADILATFTRHPSISEQLSVHLIEVSETLTAIQQKKLASYPFIHWHQSIDEVPEGFCLIIGNEFFDAFPIRQFLFTPNQGTLWSERYVYYENDRFYFTDIPASFPPSIDFIPEKPCLIETSETSLDYAERIADKIAEKGGLGLFIDYGAEKKAWVGDSLQAIKNHQFVDVLTDPGSSDITHHVDFLSIKKVFQNKDLITHDTITQREFLTYLGIELRLQQQAKLLPVQKLKMLQTAIFRLISPKYMGQLFKVLLVEQGRNAK